MRCSQGFHAHLSAPGSDQAERRMAGHGHQGSSGSGIDGKTLVLQAVDLVQLIGQTVALKKRGRSWIGLCPFHNEKTPSFHVHPDRGYFHCFGCKASGNAIDFVIKRDRVEFKEALHQLAEQYNVELPKLGVNREATGLKQALLDANSTAASFFQENLRHPQLGQAARAYLHQRGFNEETIRKFRIGLAPAGYDNLLKSPLMRKFNPELLLQAGLIKRSERGSLYDTFRERLMFPIRDEAGRVIAFGGRIMPEADQAAKAAGKHSAKYLNSPETPLFSKSRVAYGLDLARQRIVETKTVAIVEGYTDVVMAHQYGASNVVSVLGTALTESHVTVLRRFADKIVLLFDGDAAGDLAVDRALQLFLTQPIEIGIAALPGGVDPDEYLLKHGLEKFDALLTNSEDALSFQWRQLFRQLVEHEDDLTGRTKAVESYLERLSAARAGGPVDPLRWGSILARVSKFTQIPVEDLNRRFRPKPAAAPARPSSSAAGEPNMPLAPPADMPVPGKPAFKGGFQKRPWRKGNFRDERPRGPFRAEYVAQMGENPDAAGVRPPTARKQAERWILGTLLHLPSEWTNVQQVIDASEFTDEQLRPLAEWYWEYQRHEGEPILEELAAILEDDALKSVAIELASEVELMNNLRQTLAEAVHFVRQEKQRQEHSKLLSTLRRSINDARDDGSEVDVLRRLQEAAIARSGK